ncbi:hypothetical protein BU23DRAFT_570217 [Bimuria novae-zelandiae CBS 107.79]|uniref:DUF7730 domain-containing protein n=1 Tax=Bimuria novae-zelandiae CBS 107.79 TaxID=1447943 RepID=A0A6A5V237_9PLEO|nr:hypothetical protein BU23DRAFT_570217 [Bimuria novae-zelandiae CBS 107.79]
MVLPHEPYQIKDTAIKYYAYKHSTLFGVLNCLLCPLTYGCFWCWTTPEDQRTRDMIYDGLPVYERMADMHFAREGRKINCRNSLSDVKPVGRFSQAFRRQKELSEQTRSPLFSKLPYEIRREIFKDVLFDTRVVFSDREGILLDTRSVLIDTIPINPDKWDSFHKIRVQTCHLNLGGPIDSVVTGHKVRLDLSLLLTCRLAYMETLPMLYAQTQFVFNDPKHLVAFSRSIPQTHFAHIRSIHMGFRKATAFQENCASTGEFVKYRTFVVPLRRPMKEYCEVIRSMPRLNSVYIAFRATARVRVRDAQFQKMLHEMQEYHGKIRGATTTGCRVHLYVWRMEELVYQTSDRGLIEPERTVTTTE